MITPAISKGTYALILAPLLFLLRIKWIYGDSKCISQGGSEQCEAEGVILNPVASNNLNTKSSQHSLPETETNECRLYLAESSIPNAGLGIYVGVDIPKDGILTKNDLPIILTDLMQHYNDYFEFVLYHYNWDGRLVDADFEGFNTYLVMPSIGMVGNCHFRLLNADMGPSEKDVRLRRSTDPGAGAVSDYHRMSWKARRNMSKGEEIFLDYGESYFVRPGFQKVPFPKDFDKAKNIVKKSLDLLKTHEIKNQSKESIWNLIKSVASPRTKSALPDDVSSLDDALKVGLARHSLPNSIRSIPWLKENGQCMDNLKVMPSTIPQAGRGAFAARFIEKGSLVAPAPLIQITDRDQINMYELVQDRPEREPLRINDQVIGQQLLLNYCFGHSNSSLLLFPYSSGVQFINHNSKDYNAEIKWSKSKKHHSDWLEIPLENMTVKHTGLMFDIIATKDIQPNEEVFIDYGKEWEDAWKTHVDGWKPEPDADNFVFLDEVEDQLALQTVKTLEEQKVEPYPINLQTVCQYMRVRKEIAISRVDERNTKVEAPWYFKNDKPNEVDDHFRPCDIVERYQYKEDTPPVVFYTAQMFNTGNNIGEDNIPDGEEHRVYDIPRSAIKFKRKKYSSDMFLRNAFRHHIGVPEGLFPSIWMNRDER